MTEIDFS